MSDIIQRYKMDYTANSLLNSSPETDKNAGKMKTENTSIIFQSIVKHFGDVIALDNLSFEIPCDSYLCIIGASGSGKTTFLRIISGLEESTNGKINFRGQDLLNVPIKNRNISMVFQDYALFPHLTVYDNIAIGLTIQRLPKDEIREKVDVAAKLLNIEKLLKRKPRQLSGGEQQRVALGRAIIKNPDLFLLDEPLANLDADLKNSMRSELKRLQQKLNKTFIHVTHDQFEAFSIADRIILLDNGLMKDLGTPEEVYTNPKNTYSAKFIGFPKINLIDVLATAKSNQIEFVCEDFKLIVSKNNYALKNLETLGNLELILSIRAESISFNEFWDSYDIGKGKICDKEVFGSFIVYSVGVGKKKLNVIEKHNSLYKIGSIVNVYVNTVELNYFDKDSESNLFYSRN